MVSENDFPAKLASALAWVTRHKQKLLIGLAVFAAGALGVGFYFWQKAETEETANAELAKLRPTMTAQGELIPVRSSAFLQVADDYPKTAAGARARLLAGGALFAEGKAADAKAQFDRFIRDYPASPFRTDALFGSATCLAVLGKSAEAMAAFNQIIEQYPTSPLVPRAKLALGRLYAAQNRIDQARRIFEEVARIRGAGFVSYQAEVELERLSMTGAASAPSAQPQLQPVSSAAATAEDTN